MSHSANVALYRTLFKIFTGFAVLITATSEAADAQRHIDLSSIHICTDCLLELEHVLTMGNADGPGTIDSESMGVTFDSLSRTYAAFAAGQHRIVLFTDAGKFLRDIDRKGEGPGELISLAALQFIDSRLLALDFSNSKLLLMDLEGNLISTARMDLIGGPFRVLAQDRIVIASIDRRPGLPRFPLHEVDRTTGEVLQHFGSVGDDFDLSRPFARLVRLGWTLGAPNNIWRGYTDLLRIEEWTPDDTLIRVISQPPEWFNTWEPGRRSGTPPPSYVSTFGIDHQDRMWLITQVADDDWRSVSGGGGGHIRPDDLVNFFDTRIDVYDLRAQRHLGYTILDEASVGMFPHGDWLAIQRVEYDDVLVPRIAIYRPRLTNR